MLKSVMSGNAGPRTGRLLAATDSPKYRAIFMLAYGAGLRVGEIAASQVTDIDSERMLRELCVSQQYFESSVLARVVLAALSKCKL
jgi:integrase